MTDHESFVGRAIGPHNWAAQIALDNTHGRHTDEIAAHLPQSALTALEISADELIDDIASVADMQRDAASFI